MKPTDWAALFETKALILAVPGILSGILLTVVSRRCNDEAVLPLSMVAIPALFYLVLFVNGMSIEDARAGGGQPVSPGGKHIKKTSDESE